MRLPGTMALASAPTSPYTLGLPGRAAKSSISSLSRMPVSGATKPEPKG